LSIPNAEDKTTRAGPASILESGRSGGVLSGLTTGDFTEADDPFALFDQWFREASAAEVNDPEAMTLATVDDDGLPDARVLLCKGVDARGLVFYGNVESVKGRELAAHPKAAALFHWKSLRRQARFRGPAGPLTDAEVDAYFASRPRQSRIGAWASQQSRPLESRAKLEAAVEAYAKQFGEDDIPRPSYWRGWRLTPLEIEFWRDGVFRLHDRVLFSRATPDSAWARQRLYP
jgi:pyridoxamine 5'-phosphate oxidase